MKKLQAIAYTAKVRATDGRNGFVKSDDGALDVALSMPKSLGGHGERGTNPEQLFAAGYAACFLEALKLVAEEAQIELPGNVYVDAEVSIGPANIGFSLAIKLSICMNHLNKNIVQMLLERAYGVCPYSNAMQGNVEIEFVIL